MMRASAEAIAGACWSSHRKRSRIVRAVDSPRPQPTQRLMVWPSSAAAHRAVEAVTATPRRVREPLAKQVTLAGAGRAGEVDARAGLERVERDKLAGCQAGAGLGLGDGVAVEVGRVSQASSSQSELGIVVALGRSPLELADAFVAHASTSAIAMHTNPSASP